MALCSVIAPPGRAVLPLDRRGHRERRIRNGKSDSHEDAIIILRNPQRRDGVPRSDEVAEPPATGHRAAATRVPNRRQAGQRTLRDDYGCDGRPEVLLQLGKTFRFPPRDPLP